jgi:hypothetical protein
MRTASGRRTLACGNFADINIFDPKERWTFGAARLCAAEGTKSREATAYTSPARKCGESWTRITQSR